MDDIRFDRLTAVLATGHSRRRLLGTLLGVILADRLERPEIAGAKKNNNKKKKKQCPFGRSRCGNKCCLLEETCRQGRCKHRCQDGRQNLGESDTDCGSVCVGLLGANGRCQLRKKCEIPEDCRSGFCEEVQLGPGAFCSECRQDSHCVTTGFRPRCLDNFCFECAINDDCADRFDPPQPFCVFLPVAAGLNQAPCPPGQACVCRECRNDDDCPAARPHCQTGTGATGDGQCFECLEDTHCPEGQLCDEQGHCEGFECDDNEDCPTGTLCVDGACTD